MIDPVPVFRQDFEIIFGKDKLVSESGNQVVKGDTIPVVKTFPVVISQRAVLTRQ